MSLLKIKDFQTVLRGELLQAITRDDSVTDYSDPDQFDDDEPDMTGDELMQAAIDAAEAEAQGYLGSRFDVDILFARTGGQRDPALVLKLKDIAVWHLIQLSNVGTEMELRENRYTSAIDWLKNIARGLITPLGWPTPEIAVDTGGFFVTSNRKRANQI